MTLVLYETLYENDELILSYSLKIAQRNKKNLLFAVIKIKIWSFQYIQSTENLTGAQRACFYTGNNNPDVL